MFLHQTALAVLITPRWLEALVNVYHTGTALTVVTTPVIAILYVMAVMDQPLPTAITVSYMPHGAQVSVLATTHMLARNVTIVLILRPQHSNSSPNRTTAMISTVMVTA